MPRNTVVPLAEIERRAPEAGRIRLGEKHGRAMRSIETFRFTSIHKDVIVKLADLYGGQVKAWDDERARTRHQWEVKTDASSIPVYLPPNGLSVNYEKWAGGGCERRCDGVTVEIPQLRGDNVIMESSACICQAKGVAECAPYTRLTVVLPEIPFYGMWRLESKGWNAAHELPGMFDTIQALAARGQMVKARLSVEKRTSKVAGKTRHFIVPGLQVEASPLELEQGTNPRALSQGIGAEPALPPAAAELGSGPIDVEVVDAEVVDEEQLELEAALRGDATQWNLDPDRFVGAVFDETDGDTTKIRKMRSRLHGGKIIPLGFDASGRVSWKVNT